MENKQRKQGSNPEQKYPEQRDQDPNRRNRGNRPEEANIDQTKRRSDQGSGKQRPKGDERKAVEGEGETEDEIAKL
jgi:hypothetical protein